MSGTLPDHCQAALFHGPGQALTVETVPLPELRPAELLVRVRCATICASDLHTLSGRRTAPCPSVLGHEAIGEIAATGGEVCDAEGHLLQPGDRVTWSIISACGAVTTATYNCPRSANGCTSSATSVGSKAQPRKVDLPSTA